MIRRFSKNPTGKINYSLRIKSFLEVNRKVFNIFLISKILVIIISVWAAWKLTGFLHFLTWNEWLSVWSRWDTNHYISIAEHGYLPVSKTIVFFPLLPILISFFNLIFHNSIVSGLAISFIASYLSLFYFYKLLVIEKEEQKTIQRTLWLFVFFPSAIFLSAVYTESLFIFFTLASFYYYKRYKWSTCLIFVSLATLTRLTGIILLPIFLWYFIKTKAYKNRKNIIWLLLPVLTIFLFILYQKIISDDWLVFFHAQLLYWHHSLTFFGETIWNTYLKTKGIHFSYLLWEQMQYTLLILIFITISFFSKKIPRMYSWYMLFIWFLISSCNYLNSIPRYTLVFFPIFWILARLLKEKKILYYLVLFLFAIYMIKNSLIFLAAGPFY